MENSGMAFLKKEEQTRQDELFRLNIHIYPGAGSAPLSLIFSGIGIQCSIIQLGEYKLSDSAAGLKFDCAAIGVKQFQCDFAPGSRDPPNRHFV